ncbi:MAG: CDF family Co(II)/Ni(II) efflux transporter DmeF [Halieaceae bacterium]
MQPDTDQHPDHQPHRHAFGQDQVKPGERRTIWVIALTASMMIVEIIAGLVYGSMALLADGLHMASHATALAITAFAYIYARRNAHNPNYSFGTGKVNALGGFTGAILLAVFALIMAIESVKRLFVPVTIALDQAILVSVLGLLVNGLSVWILGGGGHSHEDHHHDGDHNLRSAYLHVMADALTSLLAIFALLGAKYLGYAWMDPTMGIIGSILVARWSVGLLRISGGVLLDRQAPADVQAKVRAALEDAETRVADLHVWCIGPNIHAVIAVLVSGNPHTPEYYKARLPEALGLEHVSLEIHRETP